MWQTGSRFAGRLDRGLPELPIVFPVSRTAFRPRRSTRIISIKETGLPGDSRPRAGVLHRAPRVRAGYNPVVLPAVAADELLLRVGRRDAARECCSGRRSAARMWLRVF